MRVGFSLGNPRSPPPKSSILHKKSIRSIAYLHKSTFFSSPLTYTHPSYKLYLVLAPSPLVLDVGEFNFLEVEVIKDNLYGFRKSDSVEGVNPVQPVRLLVSRVKFWDVSFADGFTIRKVGCVLYYSEKGCCERGLSLSLRTFYGGKECGMAFCLFYVSPSSARRVVRYSEDGIFFDYADVDSVNEYFDFSINGLSSVMKIVDDGGILGDDHQLFDESPEFGLGNLLTDLMVGFTVEMVFSPLLFAKIRVGTARTYVRSRGFLPDRENRGKVRTLYFVSSIEGGASFGVLATQDDTDSAQFGANFIHFEDEISRVMDRDRISITLVCDLERLLVRDTIDNGSKAEDLTRLLMVSVKFSVCTNLRGLVIQQDIDIVIRDVSGTIKMLKEGVLCPGFLCIAFLARTAWHCLLRKMLSKDTLDGFVLLEMISGDEEEANLFAGLIGLQRLATKIEEVFIVVGFLCKAVRDLGKLLATDMETHTPNAQGTQMVPLYCGLRNMMTIASCGKWMSWGIYAQRLIVYSNFDN